MTELETELSILKHQRNELDVKIALLEKEIIESENDLVKKFEHWCSKSEHIAYKFIPGCLNQYNYSEQWYKGTRHESDSLIELIHNHCANKDLELEQFVEDNPNFIQAVIEEDVDSFVWDW